VTVIAAQVMPTQRERRIPGEQGAWVFLFGDMLVFGVFFATFLVERSKDPKLFDTSRQTLHTGVGLTNTLVLLASSLFVVIAVSAMRISARSIASQAVVAAMVSGLVFVGLKIFEYSSAISAGHGAGANHFYLYYYILTGLHLFHVCIGTLVLTFVLIQTRKPALSTTRMGVVEGGACFWHLVDLLWIGPIPIAVFGVLMRRPSVMKLIPKRAGLSWLILVAATVLSFLVGADHGTGAAIAVVVLGVAAIKVRLVGLDFMELRGAPIPLRAIFEGYCALLWTILSGLYLFTW
jgi:nitric oxide reductase NorE protein